MKVSPDKLTSHYQNTAVAVGASVATISIGCVVLLGWVFDIELFKRILPRFVAMNPTTAVAFVLSGASLWLLQGKNAARRSLIIGRLFAMLVALIGILKLSEILFGWSLGVDQLLFSYKQGIDVTGQPNRIAPNTALNLVLLGCALMLVGIKIRRVGQLAQTLVILALVDSLVPLVGYLYGTKLFYGIGHFIPMALHTAIAFFVLGVGILFVAPASGLMLTVMDKSISGLMMRRLLPAVILLPVVIGWLRLEGQRLGFYDNELGVALMVVLCILILAVFVWWNSFLLFDLDSQRRHAEAQLHELTLTDDLTGLRNRRGFLLLSEHELKLARNKRTMIELWLLFIDLDGLKRINDSLGHAVGSQAITHAGAILAQTFRDSDLIARLGGDEFAVLAVSDRPDGGGIMVERLQNNIRAFNLKGKQPYRLSASIGVVRVDPARTALIEDALKQADEAMYEHKRRRNEDRKDS